MTRPCLFSLYLKPDQVAYLRQCEHVALFELTPESKQHVKRQLLQFFPHQSKVWVKAGDDWAAADGTIARKIGHQLFEVETTDLDALARDSVAFRVMDAFRPQLLRS
jgi:hypothetical protein